MSRNIKSTILKSAALAGIPKPAFGKAAPAADKPAETPKEVAPPKHTKLKFVPSVVALASLVFSGKVQARESLNKEALKDYTEIAKLEKEKGADSPFPALKAVKRGEEIIVFSGFTRGNALKAAGYTETKVEIADAPDITDAELFRLAVSANQEHGARLTGADKLHNLNRALRYPEYAELSNNALAAIVGSTEFFVRTHRPAIKSPGIRKTAKGKVIKTGNIGKKGGTTKKVGKKAQAAADALAANGGGGGDINNPDLGLGGESKKPSSALGDEAARALTRISTLLGDGSKSAGISGKSVSEGVTSGSLKLSEGDLKLLSANSEARIQKAIPLIVNNGWSPKKVFTHLDKQIEASTKVDHLINSAISGGGSVKEVIVDNDSFSVVVFNNKTHKVTIEQIGEVVA